MKKLAFLPLIALAFAAACSDAPTAISYAAQPEPPATKPPATVAEVRVTGPLLVLEGRTVQLSATAVDTLGVEVSDLSFTWLSSDEAIATVNEGRVTGKATGRVIIYATTAGVKGELHVSVRENDGAGEWDY